MFALVVKDVFILLKLSCEKFVNMGLLLNYAKTL